MTIRRIDIKVLRDCYIDHSKVKGISNELRRYWKQMADLLDEELRLTSPSGINGKVYKETNKEKRHKEVAG